MLKRRVVGLFLIALIVVTSALFAAGGQQRGAALRGQRFTIGSWHGAYDVNTYEPRNEAEEKQLEYRRKLMADNGFTLRQIELAGWDDYFQVVTNNFMSRDKSIHAYWLSAEWAMTLYKQGLLYPISDSSVKLTNRIPVALEKAAYNEMMEKLFTFGGKQYAFSLGQGGDSWQGNFVFWNKRLLREAGIGEDHPYDLQRDNRWTWDTFTDLLRRTTRDINNDGIIDIHGMPCDDAREVMNAFVYGNNANYVTIDAQGKFHLAADSAAFIEAMQFYLRLIEQGLMKTRPEGAAWDWDFTEFIDGRVAFLIAPEWRKGQMPDTMKDDYGCVLPPRGPRANNYRMSLTENVMVVPGFFTPAEVDGILTALDLWEAPADTDWKQGQYWAFRDRRAVDESVALTKDQRNVTYRNFALIPGFHPSDLIWDLWEFKGNPAQLVEQIRPRWQALIDDVNN
jgi:ABC-type glycerol-3-phosphate transport system substrate-binding protein